MVKALLDFAVIQDFEENRSENLEAIRKFFHVINEHGLEAVQFLTEEEFNRFRVLQSKLGMTGGRILSWLYSLRRHDPSDKRARVLNYPQKESPGNPPETVEKSDVEIEWEKALWTAIEPDDCYKWRDPIVLVPKHRKEDWKDADIRGEVVVKAHDHRHKRVLAVLDELHTNPYFKPDLDPWLCEDRHGDYPQVLPRPKQTLEKPLEEWKRILDDLKTWACDPQDKDKRYFLPALSWDPTLIRKGVWRKKPVFETGTKTTGRRNRRVRSGPKDRDGRVWEWARNKERHWDVQTHKPRSDDYINVNHLGEALQPEKLATF